MPRSFPSRTEAAAVVVVAVAVAVLLRWPVSVYIHELPLDPNTPLHALAARDLAGAGSASRLEMLGFPDGGTVRLLAWPLLLLALPFEAFLPPIPAFNLAVTTWMVIQGVGVHLLCRVAGGARAPSGVTALACMVAPTSVLALSNGQYENFTPLPFAFAVLGAWRGRRSGLALCALGLLAAVFSSPYQGIVAGVLALAAGGARGVRGGLAVLAAGVPVALLALPYFLAELPGDAAVHTGPASASRREPAELSALVSPTPHLTMMPADLASARVRLTAAVARPYYALTATWPTVTPVAASYLGLPLLVGVLGLWRQRRRRLIRALAAGALCCLVLAFGRRLVLIPGWSLPIPLPWALAALAPGLAGMQVTLRFLPGVSFALAIGLGLWCEGSAVRSTLAVCALLADGLLVAPVWWPVPAAAPRVAELAALLPPGPIALWPGTPTVSTERHALLAVALDRPVALFEGEVAEETDLVWGRTAPLPDRNRVGETPSAWLDRVRTHGVVALVALPVPVRALRQPFFAHAGAKVDGLEYWSLGDTAVADPAR